MWHPRDLDKPGLTFDRRDAMPPDLPDKSNLLIVDDEPDVLESVRYLFHRHYRVLTADSGSAALKLLEREEIHVILTDQRMPGMTGDELLSLARQLRPDTVRLLFTGYADMQAVIKAVNQGGIFRYILKPWDVHELESVVSQAAAQYALLAERRRLLADLQVANTQLLERNRDLAEANELKSAFLEVASHEFNTPITIIQGLSELLRMLDTGREDSEAELIEQLGRSARQLGRLVTNMLKLMRANDYRATLRFETVDLSSLLKSTVEQLYPFIQARKLHLRVDLPKDLGMFEIDADKVRDVATNLLTNAIKFTPDGGEVAILASAVEDGQAADIVVSDRGIGLDEKSLVHLFDPFFTEHDPANHSSGDMGFKKRGLGLGLSLVKRFAELHGGSVSAESSPGKGTRIAVRLPRHPCPPAQPLIE